MARILGGRLWLVGRRSSSVNFFFDLLFFELDRGNDVEGSVFGVSCDELEFVALENDGLP